MIHYNPIGTSLSNINDDDRKEILRLEFEIEEKRASYIRAWNNNSKQTNPKASSNRLTVDERVRLLADENSKILPLMDFAHYGDTLEFTEKPASRAGLLEAIVTVCGRKVLVIANDVQVAAGAWWPLSPKKIQRIQEIALTMHVPVIYLVECSGLYLPEQAATFPGKEGAGAIFRMQANLSQAAVIQIAAVFGNCIAGGGYMPLISDRIVMTESANICIGGTAINRGAKNADYAQKLGDPNMHCHLTGCADARVPDDETAIACVRQWIQKTPTSAVPFFQKCDKISPKFPITELYSILPADPKIPFDMREVIARLLDASLFAEFSADYGREIIVGIGHVDGLAVGIIANQAKNEISANQETLGSILYAAGIQKATSFATDCAANGIPLLWIQDVAGFDIGYEAEKSGLLKLGASLLYQNTENANAQLPQMTILLRKASGAGYYAMAGLPFAPTLQISTALSKIQVMDAKTLACAMFHRKLEKLQLLEDSDEKSSKISELFNKMSALESKISRDSSVIHAASQLVTDEIVRLAALPDYLKAFLEMAYQSAHLKHKPQRLWHFSSSINIGS